MSSEIPFTVCDEMKKLRDYLDKHNIVWRDASIKELSELRPVHWHCMTCFDIEDRFYSILNGFDAYNDIRKEPYNGLLEIYGDDFLKPEGGRTADDIITYLEGQFPFLRNNNEDSNKEETVEDNRTDS